MRIKTRVWDRIRKSCESTPFANVSLGDNFRLELYWSARSGDYGHQVYGVLVDYRGDMTTNPVGFKTDGCGYCKKYRLMTSPL